MSDLALRRHRLAYLSEAGWRGVLAGQWDDCSRACLDHWQVCGLPLVVTQQGCAAEGRSVALGLPAPIQYGRRRIGLRVPAGSIARIAEPPTLAHVLARVGESRVQALHRAAGILASRAVPSFVFGSYGWQALTGLRYLHPHSDLDLLATVGTAAKADSIAALLADAIPPAPRIDGELMFPSGHAVAWREWLAWRRGDARSVMVRRLSGAVLMSTPAEVVGLATCP